MIRWLKNLITLQEKRAFHGETVLMFAVFVGSMRYLLEILLVGFHGFPVDGNLLLYISWYWLCFFAFGLPVALLAPPPWQKRINVMLVGLFLGFMPPVVDVVVSGWGNVILGRDGFHYAYITNFPEGWPWLMIAPERRMPVGEGLILWGAVGFTGTYMWLRTRSVWRTALALLMSYAVCMFMGAIMPTLLFKLKMEVFPRAHYTAVLSIGQTLIALLLYVLVYRRPLARLLAWRMVHAAPLMGVALVGYAWVLPLDRNVLGPLLAITICALMTIAQNDHWDDQEEQPDAPERVTRYDVLFLTVTWAFVTWSLMFARQQMAAVMLVYGVASYLYNAPLYRGKRYFPANLKLEGLWGGSAFLLGMLWAVLPTIQEALNDPASPAYQMGTPLAPIAMIHGPDLIIALLLAFGGWSVLAAMKDEKDVDTDLRLGTQTIFTVLERRGVPRERVSRIVRGVAALCLLLGAWLPVLAGRMSLAHGAVITALSLLIVLWRSADLTATFRRTLALLTAILVIMALGISASHAAPDADPANEATGPRSALDGAAPQHAPSAALATRGAQTHLLPR